MWLRCLHLHITLHLSTTLNATFLQKTPQIEIKLALKFNFRSYLLSDAFILKVKITKLKVPIVFQQSISIISTQYTYDSVII